MFINKVQQSRVYIPKAIRTLLQLTDQDEVLWKVVHVGKSEFVVLEKYLMSGIRILQSPKKDDRGERREELIN